MVETGKPLGLTGRFQAVQWSAFNTASVVAGFGGGWLSQHVSYQWTFRSRLSGCVPMRRLLALSVGIGVVSTLAYVGLVGSRSAILLTLVTGVITMIASLAMFDLAARSYPIRAEGTFFAALMALANLGTAGGNFVGGWLYEAIGLTPLILVNALPTAACWAIIPLIRLDRPTATATTAP